MINPNVLANFYTHTAISVTADDQSKIRKIPATPSLT